MTLLRPFVIVLLAMGIVACGQQAPPALPTASAPPPPTTTPPGGFGETERAFVQLAIATNDQAVKLLDQGAAHATKPLLRAFSKETATARRSELKELHELLRSASVEYQNLHAGHDMPGMPTDPELAGLRTTPIFDAEFTRLARAHLVESRTVALSAAENATHAGTRSVASAMAEERAAALSRLNTVA